ncbi:MAG: hypothetical protein WC464_03985 [Bdellovibrionales bacterium]
MGRSSFAALLAALILVVFISFPQRGETKASQRVAYWEKKLDEVVPLNSSKESLLEWANKNDFEFVPTEDGRLSAKVEWVSGFGSPYLFCSEWSIMLDVEINPFGDVQSRAVRKVLECS